MEEELKMIPTTYKTKIPRPLSYACSAKMLSLAWRDVSQFEFLRLGYWSRVAEDLRVSTRPRHVLAISYYRMQLSQYDSHRWDEDAEHGLLWRITVHACRREDVHEVRLWLQDVGLEQARQWFEQHAHQHGEYVVLDWNAYFDEESREFCIKHRD